MTQHSPTYNRPANYNHVADMESVVDSVAAPAVSDYWERANPNTEIFGDLDSFDIPAIVDSVPMHWAAHMGLARHQAYKGEGFLLHAVTESNTAYAFGDLNNWV